MTVNLEEPPVTDVPDTATLQVTRPMSKAERSDLIAKTQRLLDKSAGKAVGDLREMDAYNRKATIYFVQACYGFYVMSDLCGGKESAFREIVHKFFPRISVKRAHIFALIGEYFPFTSHYLEFLDAIGYRTEPNKRKTVEKIESQIALLETAIPPLTEVSPSALEEYFRSKNAPAPVSPETSNLGTAPSPVASAIEDNELPAPTSEAVPAPVSTPESEILAPLFNEEDLRFDKLLDEFAGKLALPSTIPQVFEFLKGKRPLARWNPEKVARIKETLRPAKVILDELG
jgi:hypothetical protein